MARRTCTSSSSASLLVLLLSSGAALACADDEATLFACLAKDQSHTIELCAVRDDAAGGFQSLQYRYGTAETAELVFPENRGEGRAAMSFAHAFDGDAYVWSLRGHARPGRGLGAADRGARPAHGCTKSSRGSPPAAGT